MNLKGFAMQFAPAVCVSDEELLSSIQVMRDEDEAVQGVKVLVDRILANAIINGNYTELATLYRECETVWLFEFTKIYINSASVKARVTFFDSHSDDLITMNLADYSPFLHRYKIEIDFI